MVHERNLEHRNFFCANKTRWCAHVLNKEILHLPLFLKLSVLIINLSLHCRLWNRHDLGCVARYIFIPLDVALAIKFQSSVAPTSDAWTTSFPKCAPFRLLWMCPWMSHHCRASVECMKLGQWDTIIYLIHTNMRCSHNNSMDAAGAAKIAAFYVLANTDFPLTITEVSRPLMRLQPGPDAGRRAGAGWVAPSEVHSPRWHRQQNIGVGH